VDGFLKGGMRFGKIGAVFKPVPCGVPVYRSGIVEEGNEVAAV